MATEARVRSLDDLEAFRSSLIVYLTKARRGVDQAGEEIKRTRTWLMNDQRTYWTEQLRKRSRKLDQANAELMTARNSNFRENINAQQQAVRKAKTAVDEAQEKLSHVRRWTRDFDRYADPLAKKLENMRHFLEYVLPEAVTQIGQLHRLLESYTETASPPSNPPAAAAPTPEEAPPT
jgi:DNA repair exonuclease SbcCD ATPase subunit